jgi:hypothetical protein
MLFKPSGNQVWWHLTSSWVTSSEGASTWGTASALPTIDDDVYFDGKFIYANRYSNPIRIKSLSGQSRTSPAATFAGSLYLGTLDSTIPFIIESTNGFISQNSGTARSIITLAAENTNTALHNPIIIITGSFVASSTSGTFIQSNASVVQVRGGNLYIRGNISMTASAANMTAITLLNDMNVIINGNLTGSTAVAGSVVVRSAVTGSTITVNGNILSTTNQLTSPIITTTGPWSVINVNGNIETRGSASAILINTTNPNYVIVQGDINGSSIGSAISASIASDTEVLVYGNVRNSGSRNAIFAPKVYVTSSALLTIATGSVVSATQSFFQQTSNYTYPAEWDVYQNVSYGNGQTGTMTVPSSSNVRNAISYSSGSSISINNTNGTCAIPSASHTRLGILVDTAPTAGLMVVPIASQVSNSFGFESYNVSGSYSGSTDFWATPHTTITTGIGALISQSLNVRVGSITGSLIGLLDTDTSNTVTRLRSIAGVADVGNALTQSANI